MAYSQTRFPLVAVAPDTLIGQRCEAKTGRYDAFKLDYLFWDSDVAKWIEGAFYYLEENFLPEVDAAVKELVEMIRRAQQQDGYLNTHYTVLYNAGHLIEAVLAHHHVYKNNHLMEPILEYVDLFCDTFGPGKDQIHGYPGHPEIELALLRLHERTGNARHFELAATEEYRGFGIDYFLPHGTDERGCYAETCRDLRSAFFSTDITVNLYVSSTLDFSVGQGKGKGKVEQDSMWPWVGDIKFKITSSIKSISLKLRIPGWASSHSVAQNPAVGQNTICLVRGPVVYCVEDVDNPWVRDHFKGTFVDPKVKLTEETMKDDKTGDEYIRLTLEDGARGLDLSEVSAAPSMDVDELEEQMKKSKEISTLHVVPYYFRAN
ncbi:hypothetical protein BDV96DRAFT_617774 [Lophiotrema nucula]|uniref:Uncharacterized protein n=1 Tax=Lophiotrema nucula TaxID=690887 RepID=A0A6A5YDX1_9PLEO|nr:hypothetical protein BDV96DRAFT_617774 [Lophiotrema nucula]